MGKFVHGTPSGTSMQNKGAPQEAQRLEVPRCFLDETVRCITQFVHGLPTELVFNLDEVGISD
jgi:hypothetical protein